MAIHTLLQEVKYYANKKPQIICISAVLLKIVFSRKRGETREFLIYIPPEYLMPVLVFTLENFKMGTCFKTARFPFFLFTQVC